MSAKAAGMAFRGGRRDEDDDDDDDFYSAKGGSEKQALLMKQQDSTISMLASSVERVQGMARMVNEELAAQNTMIEEIDEEVDRTDSKIKSLQGKLKLLANNSDRGKYCVILLLLGLLAVLLWMVLE